MALRARTVRAVVACVATVTMSGALAACGSGSGTASGDGDPTSSGSGPAGLGKAVAAAQQRGTTLPDATPRPAATDQSIAVITLNMDASGKPDADAVVEASQALGWDAKIYNAQSNVQKVSDLVRQAVTAGATGIVTVNLDCDFATQAFGEASAGGVKIVPMNGVDCDDPMSPAPGPSVFSGAVDYGGRSIGEFWTQVGRDEAEVVIADSGGDGEVLSVENNELGILNYQQKGFRDALEEAGVEIVDTVTFSTPDFVAGRVTTQVQSSLAQHPGTTHVRSPFSSATAAAVSPGMRSSGTKAELIGAEGRSNEIALVRGGQMLAVDTLPAGWHGWAAADTLNSLFAGSEPADSALEWVLVTKDNVPSGDAYESKVDFRATYEKAWGTS